MTHAFKQLGKTLDEAAYVWLQDESPEIAAALETEILAGATVDEVRRYMVAHVGEHRTGLIARVVGAARWLHSNRG